MTNWGTELWDQYDNLSFHTNKGIEFLEKYGQFIKDRATIESEYAHKLRRLVKNYQPKKKDEEEYQYSWCRAFKMIMIEVNDLAGQRELVAENLQENVIKELVGLVKDMREDRKKHLNDGAKLQSNLQNQVENLLRAKKAYEKAYKDAEKAVEHFQRVDADYSLSRAEVEKQRNNMLIKSQLCETAKKEYANLLQNTNELQRQHYRTLLPEVFKQLQELDERRIRHIKHYVHKSAEIERNVFPIINSCLEGIDRAGETINEKEDAVLVIERYKSGFLPPDDYPFEDLSRVGSDSGTSAPMIHPAQTEQKPRSGGFTVKGTMSGKGIRKRTGIFNIFGPRSYAAVSDGKDEYSDLAPNQRLKKLNQKVQELQQKAKNETATRDGLMKMKGVYEGNPALGDPMTIEGQLNESSHRLEKLQTELKRYQELVEDALKVTLQNNSQTNSPHLENGSRNHRNSGGSAAEEDSLSRSESDSSVTNPSSANHAKRSALGTPQLNNGYSNSPESGLGTSHTSLPEAADSDHDQYDGRSTTNAEDPDFYDNIEVDAPLGTCTAMYPFEATSEGSIPMAENESLHLIETDQGDGWTRVRRLNNTEEGFVPTSYIEIMLFNT